MHQSVKLRGRRVHLPMRCRGLSLSLPKKPSPEPDLTPRFPRRVTAEPLCRRPEGCSLRHWGRTLATISVLRSAELKPTAFAVQVTNSLPGDPPATLRKVGCYFRRGLKRARVARRLLVTASGLGRGKSEG